MAPLKKFTHCHSYRRNQIIQSIKLIISIAIATIYILSMTQMCQAASRNMHQISKQTNQYFLNEFCDLQSKTLRNAKKFRTNPETFSIFLTSKNSLSSVRVLPQKAIVSNRQPQPLPPGAMSFAFAPPPQPTPNILQQDLNQTTTNGTININGTTPTINNNIVQQQQPIMPSVQDIQQYQAPVLKQLNCSIIVVAPRSHGLLVTVNSIGLPSHHAKLGITLNYDSQQASSVNLDGDVTSGKYLLTQSHSSKIAINLQSFAPIDWSKVSFDILFTVYKSKTNSSGCPNKSWFDCGDNICVPSSLVCDNNRNCPNGNDEMIFYRCYTPLFWSIAASTALAFAIAIIILIVIIVMRRRRAQKHANEQSQFSNNLLHDCNSASKAGLNYCDSDAGYLADNMTGGFENPVWLHTTNTLTKQSQPTVPIIAKHQQYEPQQVIPVTITSTTSTLEPFVIISHDLNQSQLQPHPNDIVH